MPFSDLSPRAFEQFVARVYEEQGFQSELLPEGADEGRDIIARKGDLWVVIECKHYTGNSIGRPVVQKLHSAMMTLDAPWGVTKRGALVTSGTITQAAQEYVRAKQLPIDLVDRNALLDMSASAGLSSALTTVDVAPIVVRGPKEEVVARRIYQWLAKRIRVAPGVLSDYVERIDVSSQLRARYVVTLEFDRTYWTSTGLELGRIAGQESVWTDPDAGKVVSEPLMATVVAAGPRERSAVVQVRPRLSRQQAVEGAVAQTIESTARAVSYVGGNNQVYSQTLVLDAKDVRVFSSELYVIHEYEASYQALRQEHGLRCLATHDRLLVESSSAAGGGVHLCHRCGRIERSSRRPLGTKGSCRKCSGTLCSRCARTLRSLLVRVDDYCPEHITRHMKSEAWALNVALIVVVVSIILIAVV